MRAILLASATAATLVGLRARISATHGRFVAPRRLACRMIVMAPATSSHHDLLPFAYENRFDALYDGTAGRALIWIK